MGCEIYVYLTGWVEILYIINYENACSLEKKIKAFWTYFQNFMSKFKLFEAQSILENFGAWANYKEKLPNLSNGLN